MDETPPIASINSDSNELAFSKDTPDPSEAENVNEDENGMDEIQNETESIDAEAGTVESEALNKGESLEEELPNDNSSNVLIIRFWFCRTYRKIMEKLLSQKLVFLLFFISKKDLKT